MNRTFGWCDGQSGDAGADCLGGCLDAVVKVEFGEDAFDVVRDGLCAEREFASDLLIALAARRGA